MKRMYVTLGVMFLLVFWAFSSMGQKTTAPNSELEQLQKRLELREEMHRRMMDKLINGNGPDQDMFKDMERAFEEVFSDSFTGVDSFTPHAQNFKAEWTETSSGRTLVITPKTPEQKLDINVNNNMVTIKGETETKSAQGSSKMSFNNSFSVPGDVDAKKVIMGQKDGKILVQFPYVSVKSVTIPPKNERKPLPPNENDVSI